MKKLYLAIRASIPEETVIFASDPLTAIRKGPYWIQQQLDVRCRSAQPKVSVREIICVEDIPDDWKNGALIWGVEEETTAFGYLAKHNEKYHKDYQEFLRLKAIFEPGTK